MARWTRGEASRVPSAIEPMLAVAGDGEIVDDPRYHYEYKWDGYRAVMRIAPDGTTMLTSRNGNDFTQAYPELRGVFGDGLGGRAAVLDGEIVALDEYGHPDFTLLQNRRAHPRPVSYFAFDLLRFGDTVLLQEPYRYRRELLTRLTPADPNRLAIPPSYSHAELAERDLTPRALLEIAARSQLEGLIAKLSVSKYYPGRRSQVWLKYPLIQTQEVVIGGWRPGRGRRAGVPGALLLGAHDPATGDLLYLGDVGTGFTERALDELGELLLPLRRPASPFAGDVPRDRARDARWVEPRLTGEVVYRRFTRDRRLRHTAWRGLRPDRDASEIVVPRIG